MSKKTQAYSTKKITHLRDSIDECLRIIASRETEDLSRSDTHLVEGILEDIRPRLTLPGTPSDVQRRYRRSTKGQLATQRSVITAYAKRAAEKSALAMSDPTSFNTKAAQDARDNLARQRTKYVDLLTKMMNRMPPYTNLTDDEHAHAITTLNEYRLEYLTPPITHNQPDNNGDK